MKNKIILLFVTITTLFIGCAKPYEAPLSFSDVGFMTGLGTEKTLQIGVNNYLSFADLSQGVDKHSWTIEKGNFFLKGPIASNQNNFEDLIINSGDTISNQDIINVYFKKSGNQTVRLYDVFNDSVTFRGNNGVDDYFMPSKKVGNQWVIDTTFVVKVYDTILPNLTVKQAGVSLDITSKDTVYVEAGDFLNFIDNTTQGEPTNRSWFIRKIGVAQNVASSTDVDTQIIFKKLGVFTAGITISRTGENIPSNTRTTLFPFPIKVIPSSKPFGLYGTIKELEDETIQIPFNGEIVPFSNQEAFFQVKVNGIDFTVKSVNVDTNDATLLNLKLTDPIYRPDVITISLLTGNSIESTDARMPLLFTDEPVTMSAINLLASNVANSDVWGPWWQNSTHVELSTEQASIGTKSVKMVIKPGEAFAKSGFKFANADIITLESGKDYILRYKVYIDSSNTTELPIYGQLFLLNDWGWSSNIDFSTGTIPTNQWVTQEVIYNRGISLAQLWFRINGNATKTSDATIYVDDFYLIKKEVRP